MDTTQIKNNSSRKLLLFLVAISTVTLLLALSLKGHAHFDIVSILRELGYMNPPMWLVWSIYSAGSAIIIITLVATGMGWTIPMWAAEMMMGAESAFM